jgi:hypothetical protein
VTGSASSGRFSGKGVTPGAHVRHPDSDQSAAGRDHHAARHETSATAEGGQPQDRAESGRLPDLVPFVARRDFDLSVVEDAGKQLRGERA